MSDTCMVFDARGNAFDCFDYTPEALRAEALRLEGMSVTCEPSPFVTAFSPAPPSRSGLGG